MLKYALEEGAQGIQVGTAFAYTDESGMEAVIRQRVIAKVLEGEARVRTDPLVSPTGFPFKVVQMEGTVSEKAVYTSRSRICDIGFLRHLYKMEDGKVGYRCPAEPEDAYVKKGGKLEETVGRSCLCNNLGSSAGLPQVRSSGYVEAPIITSGDDLPNIKRFIPEGAMRYNVDDVLDVLLGEDVPVS